MRSYQSWDYHRRSHILNNHSQQVAVRRNHQPEACSLCSRHFLRWPNSRKLFKIKIHYFETIVFERYKRERKKLHPSMIRSRLGP